MLNHVTWAQYGLCLLALLLPYYGFVLLRFFREEIRALLLRFGSGPPSIPAEGRQLELDFEEVMGAPAPVPGLSFSGGAPTAAAPETEQTLMIPEVLQEFKTICELLEREKGGRDDLAILLESLHDRFPTLTHTPCLLSLLETLRSQLPFYLSSKELEDLWQGASKADGEF